MITGVIIMSDNELSFIKDILTRIVNLDTYNFPELHCITLGPCAEIAKQALEDLSNKINDLEHT